MKSHAIRQLFIDYFKKHGHRHVPSSSLIPENDATLLFANAGMNQFKNLFLGLETRDYNRAVTSQKCVRAGGKHNDLENVGHTARHHTFFEMLGNFSFGDYFKKDAIHMAWDLLTNELQIPSEKLYVTVFTDDDEAADIWHKQEGVPRDRIYRFGEKDNFWRMGDIGPCGPCSEIFYDHGAAADDPFNPSKMGGDGDRYVEIWNNVFMQFNESADGRSLLPKPSVDTGGGLERWAAVLQGTHNNFNTDVFLPIIERTCQIVKWDLARLLELETLARHSREAKIKGHDRVGVLKGLAALRVVADHARASAFLISDGVMPANEGRGYVLRRIMRRAIRYGRQMTDDPSLFVLTVQKVIDEMGIVYPQLEVSRALISTTVGDEVSRFLTTLDQGTEILNHELERIATRGVKSLDGDFVFKLYDTYGFPADLTRIMAEEKGVQVDEIEFENKMNEARQKAKSSSTKFKTLTADAAHLVQLSQETSDRFSKTKFHGYTTTEHKGRLLLLSNGFKVVSELREGEEGIMIFDQTPFYAEGGGQVGDTGTIALASNSAVAEALGCTKTNDVYMHQVRVTAGSFRADAECVLKVTVSQRRATASNHSATHLLHAALRKVLGTHVTQAGSLVDATRLRFDFAHNKPLSPDEIRRVEKLVNDEIANQLEVATNEMEHQAAIAAGALALFGEKYGDRVRVVQMGDFSTELCGGTHVSNTAHIRLLVVVSESGVSAGVRRIEAITGEAAYQFVMRHTYENQAARLAIGLHESWSTFLHGEASSKQTTVYDWIEQSKAQVKALERELKSAKGSSIDIDALLKTAHHFDNHGVKGQLITASVEVDDRQILSDLSDRLKDKIKTGVVVLVGRAGDDSGKHPITVAVTKDLTAKLSAGKMLSEIAAELKGKGGGRPDFAQGAGEDLSRVPQAFATAVRLVQ